MMDSWRGEEFLSVRERAEGGAFFFGTEEAASICPVAMFGHALAVMESEEVGAISGFPYSGVEESRERRVVACMPGTESSVHEKSPGGGPSGLL